MSITVSGAFTPGTLVIEHEELVATETINYYYGPDGERVKKTSDAGTSLCIGSGYEKRSDDTYVKSIFMGDFRIAEMRSDGTIWFQHTDHLNSTNVVTNINGERAHLYEYSPYGGTTRDDAAGHPELVSGSSSTPYKYTGQEEDTETGLYYYHARYYDPELGRFIQADSIVQSPYDPQTLNRYAYCRNNPVKFVDPSGHFFKELFTAIGIAIASALGFGFLGFVLMGAAFGAVGGAVDASINGGNIAKGAIKGALYGAKAGASAWFGQQIGSAEEALQKAKDGVEYAKRTAGEMADVIVKELQKEVVYLEKVVNNIKTQAMVADIIGRVIIKSAETAMIEKGQAIDRAMDWGRIAEHKRTAEAYENSYYNAHEHEAWAWGNYVGDWQVAGSFRAFGEGAQFVGYSIQNALNFYGGQGLTGDYVTFSSDYIMDSQDDILRTMQGALSVKGSQNPYPRKRKIRG